MSSWGTRVCSACEEDVPRSNYSSAQWGKARSVSRCSTCVAVGVPTGVPSSARLNNASHAAFDSFPFASGTFRTCYRGRYTAGERAGQAAVKKEFTTHSVYEEEFFAVEEAVVKGA